MKMYLPCLPESVLTTAGEKATHIRVDVNFNRGGMNYFNYKTEPKCYQLTVCAIVREEAIPGSGMVCERMGLMGRSDSAFRTGLRAATRYNRKTEEKIFTVLQRNGLESVLERWSRGEDITEGLAHLKALAEAV